MKPSKYLEEISKELIETVVKGNNGTGTRIVAILETGDYNQTKFDLMREDEDFSYNKLIGIFPSIHVGYDGYGLIDTKKIKLGDYRPSRDGDTFVLHRLIHDYPTSRESYIAAKCGKRSSVYDEVIIELDSHFVRRLYELKNQGVDITHHINKYIVGSLKELKEKAVPLMGEVAKNIMASGHNIIEIWDSPAHYMLDGATIQMEHYGHNAEKAATKSNVQFSASGYPVLLKAAIDLYFIWYVDNLVVKGNVTDGKFVDRLLEHLRLAYERDPFEAFMYVSGVVDNNTSIRTATGYIDTILKRIKYFGSGAALNSQIPPTFRYSPIFNPSKIFKAIENDQGGVVDRINDECSNRELIAESARVDFFDIDSVIHIMALGRLKGNMMIAESVNLNYNSIPQRDREVLREASRQAHQCKVEFEFMRDKYSKREAIEKAYDTLDFIDKKRRKMTNESAINEMNSIEYALNEIIRIASEKDVKAARNEIVVKYPKGYEG